MDNSLFITAKAAKKIADNSEVRFKHFTDIINDAIIKKSNEGKYFCKVSMYTTEDNIEKIVDSLIESGYRVEKTREGSVMIRWRTADSKSLIFVDQS